MRTNVGMNRVLENEDFPCPVSIYPIALRETVLQVVVSVDVLRTASRTSGRRGQPPSRRKAL
jgi:hypothetical protein